MALVRKWISTVIGVEYRGGRSRGRHSSVVVVLLCRSLAKTRSRSEEERVWSVSEGEPVVPVSSRAGLLGGTTAGPPTTAAEKPLSLRRPC